MVAANGVSVRYLSARGFPSIRRVVRSPERWSRIVDLASQHGGKLPAAPDARGAAAFLIARRAAAPDTFPDLSLSVIKLLGRGEYVAEGARRRAARPLRARGTRLHAFDGAEPAIPDLVTQRLLKAAIAGSRRRTRSPSCGARGALHAPGGRGEQGRAPDEQGRRRAVALAIASARFDAIVTGAGPKGTWVAALEPPVEGGSRADPKGSTSAIASASA